MLTVVSKSLLCYFRFCTTVSIFYGGRLVCKNQQTRPLASLFLDKRNRLEKEIQEGEQQCYAMALLDISVVFYFLLFYIFLTDMHESQPYSNVKWICLVKFLTARCHDGFSEPGENTRYVLHRWSTMESVRWSKNTDSFDSILTVQAVPQPEEIIWCQIVDDH